MNILELIWGLSLFLFGMNVMGDALERSAGNSLKSLLGKFTERKMAGFLTGLAVTGVIQSSSATTVMVVGFVNSALMTLKQAINVIMGANVGTTVTAWLLSLGGISGDNFVLTLFKPSTFTPVLAIIGVGMLMIAKSNKKKDIGTIFLGFATLMFGMEAMSGAVKGLADVPAFQQMFIMFKNPILGVIVGAILTAVIQSSSASVGILQALAITGQVSYGAAIPIIMGQNIGTCVTAIISSVGTNINARRTAVVHLAFNIIGTIICISVFSLVSYIFKPVLFDQAASIFGIAVAHTAFNVACTVLLLPATSLLEKLAIKLVPDKKGKTAVAELDDRLLVTPSIALQRCSDLVHEMADKASYALKSSIKMLSHYDDNIAEEIRDIEGLTDHYEDIIGTYLVKLSSNQVTDEDSATITKLLKLIGDFERISDHSVNILESAEEIREKGIVFTPGAKKELETLCAATDEIVSCSYKAFSENDHKTAELVEPLEQVIDELKSKMRNGHINRLKNSECTIEAGFVWSDLLTNLERTSDHCSNVAVSVLETANDSLKPHEYLSHVKNDGENHFFEQYEQYKAKYSL
ncbi:MAG: Na/Pi cotransporter family protein [Clostridia bacterium]|nr:Na/Pi cotransporter family protein [Clostridia bacterium]